MTASPQEAIERVRVLTAKLWRFLEIGDEEGIVKTAKDIRDTVSEVPEASKALAPTDEDAIAWSMRLAGYSQAQIGKALKHQAEWAGKAIRRYQEKYLTTVASDYELEVSLECERIESLIRMYWDRAATGDLDAARFILQCSRERRLLLGLDAPSKSAHAVMLTDQEGREIKQLVLPEVEAPDFGEDDIVDGVVHETEG